MSHALARIEMISATASAAGALSFAKTTTKTIKTAV